MTEWRVSKLPEWSLMEGSNRVKNDEQPNVRPYPESPGNDLQGEGRIQLFEPKN